MDGGAWEAAVHGVPTSQTQLSNFTFTFQFHALEKEMATHSSNLESIQRRTSMMLNQQLLLLAQLCSVH